MDATHDAEFEAGSKWLTETAAVLSLSSQDQALQFEKAVKLLGLIGFISYSEKRLLWAKRGQMIAVLRLLAAQTRRLKNEIDGRPSLADCLADDVFRLLFEDHFLRLGGFSAASRCPSWGSFRRSIIKRWSNAAIPARMIDISVRFASMQLETQKRGGVRFAWDYLEAEEAHFKSHIIEKTWENFKTTAIFAYLSKIHSVKLWPPNKKGSGIEAILLRRVANAEYWMKVFQMYTATYERVRPLGYRLYRIEGFSPRFDDRMNEPLDARVLFAMGLAADPYGDR